jgi:prepilin peptidase CpaA
MNISVTLLIILAAAAAYTDLKERKIPNWLTGAGMVSGLSVSLIRLGDVSLYGALSGFAAGFGIMLVLHLCGALGAGDVKLFGAIGTLSGPSLAISIAVYSVLFAGMIGAALLIYKKQLISSGASVFYAIFGLLCLQRLDGIGSVRNKQDLTRFPFLLAVIPGLAAALWETYW